MAEVIRYDNGLRVITEHFPALRSAAVGIFVGAGSTGETRADNGLAHFTEHMMFKGTDKMSPFEIAAAFEDKGAVVNAFTSKECTCYYFKSVDENVESCFATLGHIFFDSVFPRDELEKERNVIIEEINMGEDDPSDICYDLIAEAVYGGESLAFPIIGNIGNVKKFDGDDIRRFMREHYRPENTVISFAGCVDSDCADKLVKKYILGRFAEYSAAPRRIQAVAKVKSGFRERIKDFEQSNIAVAYPTIPFNDGKTMTQSALNLIAGGGMSSRLFQSIREKQGLAYSVYTSPSAYVNNGYFAVYLNITASNTARACESVRRELEKLAAEGVSDSEFMRAGTQLKSALLFGQENCQSVMLAGGKLLLMCDEIYDVDKRVREIDAVTPSDVNEFIRRYLTPDRVCAAYVGKDYDADIMKIFKE